ncbi:MAG: amino acid ABC transporter substrate-binding protein [Hyphomicrobiaceae bacterium]|nr:amino acid ABC transporter substrate-binding protein [Hyphomicrobiaceae bacterium]
MKIARRTLLGMAGAAALMTGAFASSAAQADITIGMTVSQTGRFALAAQSGERGFKIWIDDVNSRGGIDIGGTKHKIKLETLDDRSDKALVPRVYETLIKDKKVDILMGPFGSTLTAAAANTTESFGKFLVIWSASSDKIYEQGHKHVVSATQIAASRLGKPGADAMGALGVKKLAMIYLDEPFPAGTAAGVKKRAEELGIEVVMFEKFAKGTKDFSVMIQKALASGADAFYPASYEGDQMNIARQMRELDANFPMTYMFYGSQPQFLGIGQDAKFLYSQTLWHPKVRWKVNAGLDRDTVKKRYEKLFPDAKYPADFQTALAYGAGAVLEEIVKKAQSLDPAKLKQAALDLSKKLTVITGPYEIQDNGKQIQMEFVVMQNQPKGLEVVYPPSVATGKAIYPVPNYDKR